MAIGLPLGKTKEETLRNLANLGLHGEGAASHAYAASVAALLSHPDIEIRVASTEALGNMGQEGAWFVDSVAANLESKSTAVQCAAANTLGLFGTDSRNYIGKLTKLVNCNEEALRAASIVALGQIGTEDEVESIAAMLDDKSSVVVCAACQALGLMSVTKDHHIASVAKKLECPETRYAAITALADLGARATSGCIDEIIRTCLQDKDSLTRQMAASALGVAMESVPIPQHAADSIRGLLKSETIGIRCTAALAFGYMGETALPYADDVAILLEDCEEDTSELHLQIGGVIAGSPPTSRRPKCAALVAIGMMGAESLASACAKELSDESYEVCLCALECLSNLGASGRAQSSQIIACLDANTVFVRVKACECIGALKAEDAMSGLVDLFEDRSPSVRIAALHAFSESPRIAESFSNEVLKCLNDPAPQARAAAVTVLGNLGEMGHCYASAIAALLGDDDVGVKCAVCEALGKLGEYGAAFAEEIAWYTEADDPELQASAATALELMEAQGPSLVQDAKFMIGDVGEME